MTSQIMLLPVLLTSVAWPGVAWAAARRTEARPGSTPPAQQTGHRLLVINPNTSRETTAGIAENARRYARPGTEIIPINPDAGPNIILGYYENQLATANVLRKVESVDPASYDAVIVAAYSDAGLYGLRELLSVPVIGIAEASMLFAHPIGYRFSIVSFIERLAPFMEDVVTQHGFEDRLASIRLVEIPVGELRDDAGRPNSKLIAEARAALQEDGAEVILLGGATLTGLDKELEREIGAPVIDGVAAAVKMAEGLLDYGVHTSKVKAFQTPESKR